MKTLTIVYTSARTDCKLSWFGSSLSKQGGLDWLDKIRVVIVSPHAWHPNVTKRIWSAPPKPTLWQGPHRVTSQDFWAVSNARNTGICLAETEWIAFLDDRCVLNTTWLQSIKAAMDENYAVFGCYEKRVGMKVENGRIVQDGTVIGLDHRIPSWEKYTVTNQSYAMPCPYSWSYGCTLALPLEWALQIGGFEEALDGSGAEDTAFGAMLKNNGYDMRFDCRMGVVQDRTPSESGPTMRREDKGVTPNDKSHRGVELFHSAKNTSNRHLLLQSRQAVLAGKPFPALFGPREDWWDGASIGPDYMRIDNPPQSP